jgi:hypothetical protein
MRAVTVGTFRDDPLFPKVSRAVEIILEKDKVVRPIDLLIGIQLLRRDDLEELALRPHPLPGEGH